MKRILLLSLAIFLIGSLSFGAKSTKTKKQTGTKTTKSKVSFRSCKAARAAGYSNMKRGEPGYSKNLDRDNDGIACER
ncbi:Excalibur calcium-binding domain [Sebaldella termitidis]|uniref:Excalibur domain protein n=1 Tax=Sebaldella termitidis (strain ATCC 33386 / NCTC 11300) TaxID=526218 RepID=D1AGP4_SEBTE|nr:excalibur calcium-binding domain-containing protein [Sebaldella termitidis]ACZ10764.1 Excalibur domain protein [Sebaldella termitidis ATCC 33386]SUI26107.1 Excalibur calcium-binding domain [Sebaldella termitidis]